MRSIEPELGPCYFLVIGYGNELRSDDGIGPRLARRIAAARFPGVRAIAQHQLTPELAEPISRAKTVMFVDASCQPERGPCVIRLAPGLGHFRVHESDPTGLLNLAQELYARCPSAWWITLPGYDFGFGQELSPRGQQSFADGMQIVQQILIEAAAPCVTSARRFVHDAP